MTKQEYIRLRRVALKRINRLEKAGLSKTLLENYGHGEAFKAWTTMTPRERTVAKRKVEGFLKAKTSTVSGAKRSMRNIVRMLNNIMKDDGFRKASKAEQAIFETSEETVNLFGEFMKSARNAVGDMAFDSERAVKAFKMAKEKGLPVDKIGSAFKDWIDRNVDRKIERRKTQVTDDDLTRYLTGESNVGNNKRGRTNRRKDSRHDRTSRKGR